MTNSLTFPLHPKRILFVCTGNICRSVFAEGILRKLLTQEGLEIEVDSAGTAAIQGRKALGITLKLLAREGIDMKNHSSCRISFDKIESADLIFVMENNHRKTILNLAPSSAGKIHFLSQFYSEAWKLPNGNEIPDPMGMYDLFHENVNEIIRACCEGVLRVIQGKYLKKTIFAQEN